MDNKHSFWHDLSPAGRKLLVAIIVTAVGVVGGFVVAHAMSHTGSASSVITSTCNGFRQWQSTGNDQDLDDAASNIQHWTFAHTGSSPKNVLQLSQDINDLQTDVNLGDPNSDQATEVTSVTMDCRGA